VDSRDKRRTKKEQVEEFLEDLSEYTKSVAQDVSASCSDSYTGFAASEARNCMKKSLYKLFDIKELEDG
jgi:hypothetical protein